MLIRHALVMLQQLNTAMTWSSRSLPSAGVRGIHTSIPYPTHHAAASRPCLLSHAATSHAQPQPTSLAATQEQLDAATSAYVHLPFCKRKCWYCDFPVQAVGSKLTSDSVVDRMQSYVDQVCREVQATAALRTKPLQTVYFGGGTPSLVPPALVGRILHTLDRRYGLAPGCEVTLEADPGTFDAPRLRAYMAEGVTRVSMGVQSFQQELLEACGRSHSLAEVHRAIEAVHASGVCSWSLDLISGLPHLTPDMWGDSLAQAVRAQPTHISVYDLQVEEGTPFARWYAPGRAPLPPDEAAAHMYATASHTLRAAGYEHYEVSNYARPGHRSRHNQVYWSGAPYYAFGQGAASYLSGRRFSRPASPRGYAAWLDGFTAAGGAGLPGADMPPQTQEDRMLEYVMLRLRTADGLDLPRFEHEYGADMAALVQSSLAKHVTSGLVLLQTQPQGMRSDNGHAARRGYGSHTSHHDNGSGQAAHQGSASGCKGQVPLGNSCGRLPQAECDVGRLAVDGLLGQGSQKESGTERRQECSGSHRGSQQAHNQGRDVQGPGTGHELLGSQQMLDSLQPLTTVRLSDPEGFLVSNDIISDVFAAMSDVERHSRT